MGTPGTENYYEDGLYGHTKFAASKPFAVYLSGG